MAIKIKSSRFEPAYANVFGVVAAGVGLCLVAAAAADHDIKVHKAAQISHDMCVIKEEGLKEFMSRVDSDDPAYKLDSSNDIDRYAKAELKKLNQIKNGSAQNIIQNVFRLEAVAMLLTRRNLALSINFGNEDKPFIYSSPIKLFAVLHDWMYNEIVINGSSTHLTKIDLDDITINKLNKVNDELSAFVNAFIHEIFDLDVDRVKTALQNAKNVPFLKNVRYIENAGKSAIISNPVDEKFIRNEEDQKLFQESFSKVQDYIEENYGKANRADTIKEALNLMFGLMQTYKDQKELKQNLHVIETNYGLA